MIRRRSFITLLGGAAVARPLAARAQQREQMRRVGMLQPIAANDPEAQARVSAFQGRLQELGWVDGRNVRIDYRWAPGGTAQIRYEAAELVKTNPQLIVGSSTPVVAALRAETHTIPILFTQVVDAVAAGFVANLARPGGNVTGVTNFEFAMGGKWLEILKEISPQVVHVSILYNPNMAPYAGSLIRSIVEAAPSFAIQPTEAPFQEIAEVEHVIDTCAQKLSSGLLVLPDVDTVRYRDLIISRVAERRLPAVYPFRSYAVSGGLVSYGSDSIEPAPQIASYVDRVLRSTKTEDLPVQAPVKFELVINLKTAKTIGLTVPPMLLTRADEVIE